MTFHQERISCVWSLSGGRDTPHYFNGGLTAYGSFVINDHSLDDEKSWWGILKASLCGFGGGMVGGAIQARNAAKAAADGLTDVVAKRSGGLSPAEWVRTVATLPGDYFIAKGTRSPSQPEPPPISSDGLRPLPSGLFRSPESAGTAGRVEADTASMEEAGHKIKFMGEDLAEEGQRFTSDSHLGIAQFGTTNGDMEMGIRYGEFRDAVERGLRVMGDG